jgi:hypothetical protein
MLTLCSKIHFFWTNFPQENNYPLCMSNPYNDKIVKEQERKCKYE